jgi:hypothetical protein
LETIMSGIFPKLLVTSLAVAAFAAGIASASADTPWQQSHPRREQVNNRLQNQNARIHGQVAEGELSKSQAHSLHARDRSVRRQERRMAARDGGHLTKKDQHVLNRRENRISRKIGH